MIDPGDGWKFRNHLEDYVLFEDQVVEHMTIGHQAVRRAFGPKLNEDEAAFEAVKKQATESAAIAYAGYPSIFMTETVSGHFCIYYEYIEGKTLESFIQRKLYKDDPEAWANAALDIVKLAQDFEQRKIAYDRILPKDIVFNRNLARVANRWPVGSNNGLAEQSKWAQRLKDSKAGGVYLAEGTFPRMACMERLKDLLFFMATGQSVKTVEKALEDLQIKEQEMGARAFSRLQLPAAIEDFMLRMHNPKDQRALTSIEEVKTALMQLCPNRGMPVVSFDTGAATAAASSYREKDPTPATESAPEFTEREPTPEPVPERRVEPKHHEEMKGKESLKDDTEEDRSFLYPTSKAVAAAEDSRPTTSSVISGSSASRPRKHKRSSDITGNLIKILIGITVLAIVFVGGYFLYLTVATEDVNEKPTAHITQVPEEFRMLEKTTISGRDSTDPEGLDLSFTWEIPELESTDYRITPNRNKQAETATLEVFQSGEYTLQLSVFDGQNYSAKAAKKFTVLSAETKR